MRAEPLAGGDLNERGVFRHHHGDRDAEQLAVVGEAECVVAGAGRNDATFFSCGRKPEQRVARAALLERAGALEVVEFADDLRPGDLGERNRFRAGRDNDAAGDTPPRGTNL